VEFSLDGIQQGAGYEPVNEANQGKKGKKTQCDPPAMKPAAGSRSGSSG
jgi:hypothetical protein